MTVQCEVPFASATAVSIEYEDSLYLGEVIVCSQESDVCTLEIKVEQILNGLQSLMALRATLLNESSVKAPRMTSVGQVQYSRA